ncbi:hypothetical protein QJS04_geneDACA018535 [Acorus gramineus]|uniref:Uncharacterized protein n=1 Tax=Acorus gramineus TaxID=55184 RepID=A0AAV9AXL6_ACOGR|nr:hypothetical protein QJS04_geneDACA018535 [Acorus gramineus]
MAEERRRRFLPDFELPGLKWGCQRILRCEKVRPDNNTPIDGPDRPSVSKSTDEEEIQDNSTDKAQKPRQNFRVSPPILPPTPKIRPTRRSVFGPSVPSKSQRLRGIDAEKKRIVQFHGCLSQAEIERDFFIITGLKPSSRPKRSPKVVQRTIDTILPGSQLPTKITPRTYKIQNFN